MARHAPPARLIWPVATVSGQSPDPPVTPTSWPSNDWLRQAGYMISDANQLVDETKLTRNAEKDILIPQMIGFNASTVEAYTGYYKNVKQINPDIKILFYTSPNVADKVDGSGISGPSWYRQVIVNQGNSSWWLRNSSGDIVQSAFNANRYRTNICSQFNTVNGSGRTFAQEVVQQQWAAANVVNVNGKFIDYIDGLYLDVIPPAMEPVYIDGSDPRIQTNSDWNDDGSADGRGDETIPANPANEDGYGGARMWRRGMADWYDQYKAVFGSDFAVTRNASLDGLDYSSGVLSDSTHPMSDSEFYGKWDGGLFEKGGNNGLGIRKNESTGQYDISFNGFGQVSRHLERIKTSNVQTGHIWGKYGPTNVWHEAEILTEPWDATDYSFARFQAAIAALNGVVLSLRVWSTTPFEYIDEYVYPFGDTVNPYNGNDGDQHRMGTLNPFVPVNGANEDWGGLRTPDSTENGGTFYWAEYENGIIVLRSDFSGGNVYGYGSAVSCTLPSPGAGNKWTALPYATTYTNPNNGKQTKGQDTSLNDGSDATTCSLKPAHAQFFARVAA